MSYLQKITEQSPWILDSRNIEQDIHLEKLNGYKYVYRYKPFLDYEFADGVYILTGPRQVGKTTHLKMLVQSRLQKLPSSNFLYFNCDYFDTKKEIVDCVETYVKNFPDRAERTFILLDEVTSVRDGFLAVKFLVDSGYEENISYILSGSSTINIQKTGEYLPGRRGKGIDFHLLPLGFNDYLHLRYPETDFSLTTENFEQRNLILSSHIDLKSELDMYLRHGGIPRLINAFHGESGITEELYSMYRAWITSETAKADRKERLVKLVLNRCRISLASDTSYNAFSQEMNIGSHNTVYEYLDFLERSFLIHQVYHFDIHSKKVNFRKNKKFYFTDPFIYSLVDAWVQAKQKQDYPYLDNAVMKSRIIENCVYLAMKSKFEDVYYFRNSFEIDFVAQQTLVEVKYQNTLVPDDIKSFRKYSGRKYLVSKNHCSNDSDVIIIPVELFLLLEEF